MSFGGDPVDRSGPRGPLARRLVRSATPRPGRRQPGSIAAVRPEDAILMDGGESSVGEPTITGESTQLGTILGPHALRGAERPACLRTSYAETTSPQTSHDLPKRFTATYWGSSGRRFKSCQPDFRKAV